MMKPSASSSPGGGEQAKEGVLGRHDRRAFIVTLGGLALVASASGAANLQSAGGSSAAAAHGAAASSQKRRRNEAYQIRLQSANEVKKPWPDHPTNGDEERYPSKIASFSKCLPSNDLAEVDLAAYQTLVTACDSGDVSLFESVPMAGTVKLSDPQGAFTYGLEGQDSHQMVIDAPPAFASQEEADEMVELYWHALTRDVPFEKWQSDPVIAQACTELSSLSAFYGPREGGKVTPQTLFRGGFVGDTTGPFVSQFLLRDVPYGSTKIVQKYKGPVAESNFMTSYPEWLANQRGVAATAKEKTDPVARYFRNQSDLTGYVHKDFPDMAFINAALLLLGMKAPLDAGNPYLASASQSGFICFAAPHVLDLVSRATTCALKAAWFQKWCVARRLRPEAFGGRIQNLLDRKADYPIQSDVLNSLALATTYARHGSYLLPQAYPEGAPTHPSYPAGHATIAGACATVLKAFFDESYVMPDPVVASSDGLELLPYHGASLTVNGELNKLAANISLARDMAGVHWRSDGVDGMLLGQAVALGLLSDMSRTYTEDFQGFSVTLFDGSVVTV